MPGVRVELIYNGLDEGEFEAPRAARIARESREQNLVSFVGRLVPVKRVDLFLAMASRLVRGQASSWKVRVIGDGPLREALEGQAVDLGLGEQVEFLGFRRDVNELVAGSDVLVFTSDHEGTPMAALEALAMGVPVVARAVGGLVEMLQDVEGCRLVDGDDPRAIAEAVRQVVDDAARHAVRLPPRYRIDTCAGEYLVLYRELTAGGPLTRPSC
jgi:glycosyltransferase involved in cell wall biosynthesis